MICIYFVSTRILESSRFLNHFLLFVKLNLKLLILITKQKANKEASIKELLMACYSINRKTKSYIISEFTCVSLALRRRRYRSTWDLYRCAVIASWKLNPIPPNTRVKYLWYLEFLQTLLERVIMNKKKSWSLSKLWMKHVFNIPRYRLNNSCFLSLEFMQGIN